MDEHKLADLELSPMRLAVMTARAFRGMRHAMPGVAGRIEQAVAERSASLVC